MAGLFSGASTGPALEDLGASIGKLGMTIYGKLDEAERISQFNLGQTQLTNAMNKVDYERSQNPSSDFLTWQDDDIKKRDEAWQTIEKTLTNQGAKNQLNDWWQAEGIQRSRNLETKVIGARINQIRGNTDQAVSNVLKTNAPYDVQEKDINKLYDDGVSIGAFHPEEAAILKAQHANKIEYEDLKRKAIDTIIKSGGDIEAGLKLVYDSSGQYQNLNEDDITKIASFTEVQGKFLTTQAREKAKKEDDTQYMSSADKVISGELSPDGISKLEWKNPVASKNNAASLIALYDKMHPKSGGKPIPTKVQYQNYIKKYDEMISGQNEIADDEKSIIDSINKGDLTGAQGQELIKVAQMGPGSSKQALTEANSVIKAGMMKPDGTGIYDAEEAQRLITMMNSFVVNSGNKIDRKMVYDEAVRVSELSKDKVIGDALQNALQKPSTVWNLFQKGQPLYKDISNFLGDIKDNKYEKLYDDPTVKEIYSDAQNAIKDKLKQSKVPASAITGSGIDPDTHLPIALANIEGVPTIFRLNIDKDANVILEQTTKADKGVWRISTR